MFFVKQAITFFVPLSIGIVLVLLYRHLEKTKPEDEMRNVKKILYRIGFLFIGFAFITTIQSCEAAAGSSVWT